MGGSNEKVDYTELSKSSISDKIKPKKRSHFVSKSKLKKFHLKEKKESVNDTKKRNRAKKELDSRAVLSTSTIFSVNTRASTENTIMGKRCSNYCSTSNWAARRFNNFNTHNRRNKVTIFNCSFSCYSNYSSNI